MTSVARALEIFSAAVALAPEARTEFLERACADDIDLRRQVEAMLAFDAHDVDSFSKPIGARIDRNGELVGVWRLERLIGSGGMGSVYRATRADRAYDKRVAIKFLLFDAGDLRRRFALEQRILGSLNHPNIATLLDVGSDAHGAPYFVMEYIDGSPITTYAQDHALDVRARIALFLHILDAMHAAHSQLIVHRDIKPSNVLVDAQGVVKLLDFGVAKLLDDGTAFSTRTGLGPLTPEYASPEQVRGEPPGTPSDVYSLGVLLFELVTGKRPYAIIDTSPGAIERTVCEVDPPRPSAKMGARRIGGSVRDLDAIVLKALEKAPRRRYASCATFAEDLRRWLDGAQVLAREPAVTERTLRFVRRHRFGAAIATTALLTLLIGTTLALWQAHEAILARNRAERINGFLQDMLGAADHGDLGRDAKLGDVLDTARRNAEVVLNDDPATLGATELTLAEAYGTLGDLDNALKSGNLALAIGQKSHLPALRIDAEIALSNILTNRGEFSAAEKMLKQVRADALASGTARQRGESAVEFGLLETKQDHPPAAQLWLKTALDELPSDLVEPRAAALNDLGVVQDSPGTYNDAVNTLRQCIAMLRAAYPNGHPLLAQALGNLAGTLDDIGEHAAASAMFAESLRMKIDLMGEDHFSVIGTLSTLTWRSVQQNDAASALDYGARAWAGAQKLSPENPSISYAAITYAQALMLAGRPREALPLVETALKLRKANLAPDSAFIVNTESVLALAEAQAGDVVAGAALAQSAYAQQLAKLGGKHPLTLVAEQRLAQIAALRKPAASP